jgi:hypothetical protein
VSTPRHGFFRVTVALLAVKLVLVLVSVLSGAVSLPGVPETSWTARVVALGFVGSSIVLVLMRTRVGVLSTLCLAVLSLFSAAANLLGGRDVVWFTVALLTSAALLAAALPLWRGIQAAEGAVPAHPPTDSAKDL